ncbi:MAG: hypothetical protein ABID79_02585 [Elusimicrobiota bacterium]
MIKIMSSGTEFFLCIGTGLGIGLFAGPGWGWQSLVGAIIIAIANILLKSEHYQNYIANCEGKEIKLDSSFLQKFILRGGKTKPSVILYIILSFLQNSVIIFIVAFIVFFITGFLYH